MTQTEKKLETQAKLKRIGGNEGIGTYDEAAMVKQAVIDTPSIGATKVKIIARNTGLFDVYYYAPIVAEPAAKAEEPKAEKVHGLKAKERRAKEKK